MLYSNFSTPVCIEWQIADIKEIRPDLNELQCAQMIASLTIDDAWHSKHTNAAYPSITSHENR